MGAACLQFHYCIVKTCAINNLTLKNLHNYGAEPRSGRYASSLGPDLQSSHHHHYHRLCLYPPHAQSPHDHPSAHFYTR